MKAFYVRRGTDLNKYGFKKIPWKSSHRWVLERRDWPRISIDEDSLRITFDAPTNDDLHVLCALAEAGRLLYFDDNEFMRRKRKIRSLQEEIRLLKEKQNEFIQSNK